MSLLGLPAQVIDRLLGTTTSRPVPFDTNGDADYDDDLPKVSRYVHPDGLLEFDDHISPTQALAFAAAFREKLDEQPLRKKLRRLGRQYGRASRTIGEQRGTIASLRAQLAAALSNDGTGPIPAAEDLEEGDAVPEGWFDGQPGCGEEAPGPRRYRCTRTRGHTGRHVATDFELVRSVWHHDDPLPEWEQELLFTETPGPPKHSGAPGKPGQVERGDHHSAGVPAGAEAGEGAAPAGTDREARADKVRDDLARALGDTLAIGAGSWDELSDAMRTFWRDTADAVINAGWLPPRPDGFDTHVERIGGDLASLGLLRPPRSAVVQVLTDHELLADDTCRCGWGLPDYRNPENTGNPLWHAEHVAQQLALQGVAS